jgi:hypothetical protein
LHATVQQQQRDPRKIRSATGREAPRHTSRSAMQSLAERTKKSIASLSIPYVYHSKFPSSQNQLLQKPQTPNLYHPFHLYTKFHPNPNGHHIPPFYPGHTPHGVSTFKVARITPSCPFAHFCCFIWPLPQSCWRIICV